MNKNYLILGLVFLSGTAFAQKNLTGVPKKEAAHQVNANVESTVCTPGSVATIENRAPGDPIIYEDFANGLAGNTTFGAWTTSGADGAIWLYDTDGPNGNFSSTAQVITSTTASNGFMIFDSNLSNNTAPYVNRVGQLVSPVMDLSAYTNVTMIFQQAWRHCCDNSFEYYAEVSSDGFTSEVLQVIISDRGTQPFFNGVNAVPGTMTTKIDLTNVLSMVANPTTVQVRFNHDGSGGTSHYFWMIDDFSLIEARSNDLEATGRRHYLNTPLLYGLDYPIVPVDQRVPFSFYGGANNVGSSTANNAILTVNVKQGTTTVYTGTSSTTTIPPATSNDSLNVSSWNPGSTTTTPNNTYTVEYVISHGTADDDNTDNMLTRTVYLHQTIYARDEGTPAGNVRTGYIKSLSGSLGEALEIGNVFEISTTDTITDIQIGLASSSINTAAVVGKTIVGKVYLWDGTTYSLIAETDFYTLVSGNFGQAVTLPLLAPVAVNSGDDLLVVASHSGGAADGTEDVGFGTAGVVDDGTVLGFTGGSLFQLTAPQAVIVRPVFNENVSVGENETGFYLGQNAPNPFNGYTSVSYSLTKNATVSFDVVDITGKLVYSSSEGEKAAGVHKIQLNAEGFAAGVYYYTLTVNGQKMTKKMVITEK